MQEYHQISWISFTQILHMLTFYYIGCILFSIDGCVCVCVQYVCVCIYIIYTLVCVYIYTCMYVYIYICAFFSELFD